MPALMSGPAYPEARRPTTSADQALLAVVVDGIVNHEVPSVSAAFSSSTPDVLGDDEVFAEASDPVVKPRAQWHGLRNASAEPVKLIEIITQGRLEEMFHMLDSMPKPPAEAEFAEIAARYGGEIDFAATGALIERHGLVF